jgi:hypothetical protein
MRSRSKFAVVLAAVALIAVGAGVAIAQVAGVTKAKGGSISKVRIKRGENATATSSTDFVNIPGAKVKIKVARHDEALILARFSAESACYDTANSLCSVRILVDGQEAKPASGINFAFDSTDAGTETSSSWESHSMDRSLVVGGGRHTVRTQFATTSSTTGFRVDDWSLTVERSNR